ncbi:hypothetical protein [Methanotorris formicicus]|uniref:Uncharacterized protein n=1 Tax=Methanotorris formicicus Mc-S-70 TaxID=647171 RepID=H1L1J8_9EURY|nr:hypothetical protein [Methanotorris formicicus]EHP83668.1 hypothetical protein MetfoDRAFT_1922 [Methanotorris formicicus Mc-S-70]
MQTHFTIEDLMEFINIKNDAKGEIFELIVWLALKKEFKLERGETFDFKIKGTKTYIECKYAVSKIYPNRYNRNYCQVYELTKRYLNGKLEKIYLATTKETKTGHNGIKDLIKKFDIDGFKFYIYELDILYYIKEAVKTLPISPNLESYLSVSPNMH